MNLKNRLFIDKKDAILLKNFSRLFLKTVLLGVLFIGVLFLLNKKRKKNDNAVYWVQHSKNVLLQSEKTISFVKDYEGASRGFIISNNEDFLDTALYTKDSIKLYINNLYALVADNATQKKTVDSLYEFIKKRILYADSTVQLRKTDKAKESFDLVSSGIGKRLMDTVKMQGRLLQQREKDLLLERQQENNKTKLQFEITIAATLIVFFISLLILFWQAWFNLKKYYKRQQEVNKILSQLANSLIKAQQIGHFGSWERIIATSEEKWSDEQYRIFGYQPGNSIEQPLNFINCIHPKDKATVNEVLKNAIENKHSFSLQFSIVQPNGAIRFIKAIGEVYMVADKGLGIGGTMQDITEEHLANQEKNKMTLLLQKTNSIGQIGWWDADIINNTAKWSDVIKNLLEIPLDFEPTIDSFLNFINHFESREAFKNAYSKDIVKGISFDLTLLLVTPKGNNINVRITGEPVMDNKGICTSIIGVFQQLNTVVNK
jgi:CHASE3 domain sensor protein